MGTSFDLALNLSKYEAEYVATRVATVWLPASLSSFYRIY